MQWPFLGLYYAVSAYSLSLMSLVENIQSLQPSTHVVDVVFTGYEPRQCGHPVKDTVLPDALDEPKPLFNSTTFHHWSLLPQLDSLTSSEPSRESIREDISRDQHPPEIDVLDMEVERSSLTDPSYRLDCAADDPTLDFATNQAADIADQVFIDHIFVGLNLLHGRNKGRGENAFSTGSILLLLTVAAMMLTTIGYMFYP